MRDGLERDSARLAALGPSPTPSATMATEASRSVSATRCSAWECS